MRASAALTVKLSVSQCLDHISLRMHGKISVAAQGMTLVRGSGAVADDVTSPSLSALCLREYEIRSMKAARSK
jgi:hypothetical protein